MLLKYDNYNALYNKVDKERWTENRNDDRRQGFRDEFERDYGRIIHSSAFRRLQGKTQVIGPEEGDFHRTRLTHTLEVCQIARGITIQLNNTSSYLNEENKRVDTSLIEAAALAHDLGHPPFGHQGERALNESMQKFGLGFEGNAHTFRLLTRLEGERNTGLDLTRGTLLAVLKYPILFKEAENSAVYNKKEFSPPKASVFEEDNSAYKWLTKSFSKMEIDYLTKKEEINEKTKHYKTINKTLECSIIELADDIAYATHDLEDALSFKLITLNEFQKIMSDFKESSEFSELAKRACELKVDDKDYKLKLKMLFADLIHLLISSINLEVNKAFHSNRIKFKAVISKDGENLIDKLENLVYNQVILSQRVQTIEWKGGYIIRELFDAMINDLSLLPKEKRNIDDSQKARTVCDYIAGMTDSYAQNMYSRLFESKSGRLFDI